MKKVVIDSNILFSSFLKSGNKFRDIIFSNDYEFYSCNFTIVEIFKYKEKIVKYSKLEDKELLKEIHNILKNINFISDKLISEQNIFKSVQLCNDIDKKDFSFLALAFELNALLWTGDKELKDGLKKKGINIFFEV